MDKNDFLLRLQDHFEELSRYQEEDISAWLEKLKLDSEQIEDFYYIVLSNHNAKYFPRLPKLMEWVKSIKPVFGTDFVTDLCQKQKEKLEWNDSLKMRELVRRYKIIKAKEGKLENEEIDFLHRYGNLIGEFFLLIQNNFSMEKIKEICLKNLENIKNGEDIILIRKYTIPISQKRIEKTENIKNILEKINF